MSESKENAPVNTPENDTPENSISEPKEDRRSKEKLSVNEAMNEYYKLKAKYENCTEFNVGFNKRRVRKKL